MATDLTRYNERLAKLADQYTSAERSGGDFVSIRGGVLTVDDTALPGNQMCVIVLDAVKERTFYATKYDANAEFNLPPVCYAFGRLGEDDSEIGPHESMQAGLHYFKPQSDVCQTCPHNEWGSSDTGRGKACGERRRLAIIPAGYYEPKPRSRDLDLHLIEDVDHFEEVEIGFLKLPVMSVKEWARYVSQLGAQHRIPPLGAVTRIYVEPDPQSQFRVKFEFLDFVNQDLLDTILRRHDEASERIVWPYNAPSQADIDAANGNGSKRSARRRVGR